MGYKVYNGGTEYIAYTSAGKSDMCAQDHDIVVYTVNNNGDAITARIERPSNHTLYLISQGRCWLDFSYRCTAVSKRNHSGRDGRTWRRCFWQVKVTDVNNIQLACGGGYIGGEQEGQRKVFTDRNPSTYRWCNCENISGILYLIDQHHDVIQGWYFYIKPLLISAGSSTYTNVEMECSPAARPYKTNGIVTCLGY